MPEKRTDDKPVPLDGWREDDGAALWWRFPVEEPPYVGDPLCDDWPGYHTHFTPIPIPDAPDAPDDSSGPDAPGGR